MNEFDEAQLAFLLEKYTAEYLAEEYGKHFVLVYEKDGKILGLGSFISDEAEIRGIYITPKHQGEGIGGQLIKALEEEAKKQNVRKVCVKSYFKPEPFYAKNGYKRVEEGEVSRGKVKFQFVKMEKKI